MTYYISAVVSHSAELSEDTVDWPLTCQILPVDASCNFIITSFSKLLELRAKGEDVKPDFLKKVEFECMFEEKICKFDILHLQKQIDLTIWSYNMWFVEEDTF